MKNRGAGNKNAARVALVQCRDYDPDRVEKAVEKAVEELGGIDRFVPKGSRVLLKPNLLIARPAETQVTTHPEVVRAMIKLVKGRGARAQSATARPWEAPSRLRQNAGSPTSQNRKALRSSTSIARSKSTTLRRPSSRNSRSISRCSKPTSS